MTSPTGHPSRAKGFALVEALIAVMILACGVAVCLRALSQSVLAVRRAEAQRKDAGRLARAVFEVENGAREDLRPLTLETLDPDLTRFGAKEGRR